MKATTGYEAGTGTNGLWLKIPSQGHAPLLLLEWVRRQSQVWFEAYMPDEEEDGTISFRFGTPGRNTKLRMQDCCDYINANLPQEETGLPQVRIGATIKAEKVGSTNTFRVTILVDEGSPTSMVRYHAISRDMELIDGIAGKGTMSVKEAGMELAKHVLSMNNIEYGEVIILDDGTTEARMLAMAYSTVLRSWLTEEQMEKCISGEMSPDEFCDSNMAMNTAFIGVTGRLFTFYNDEEPDSEKQNEIDTNLVNHAHSFALHYKYQPEKNPIMVSIDKAEPVTIYDWIWDSVGPTEDFSDIDMVNAIRNTIVGADVAETIDMVRTA